MTGAHPKEVQQIMRHQSITLTMDTYGHLFPGQEAEAHRRMRPMLVDPAEILRATGTGDQAAGAPYSAQRLAQQTARETLRPAANGKVTTARKRKRPSLCRLQTWTPVCDAMRLLAQVAEEGLEVGVNFRGKTYTLALAGDSRGIIRAEHQ
jgi:hypothetical protein